MAATAIEEHDDDDPPHVVLHFVGDLDASSAGAFRDAVAKLAHRTNLVVQLSQVPFIDSAGLGALIGALRSIRDHGGRAVLVIDKPAIARTLHTTGFDRIVAVTETYDEALDVLSKPDEFETG